METGITDRTADYISGNNTDTLTFQYIVLENISDFLNDDLIHAIVSAYADKGYDAAYIRNYLRCYGINCCIPYKKNSMSTMVLDKGYDSESIHKTIRDENIISMIPVRGENTIGSTKGKYRKQMRREFDVIIYSQRNKTETIFSVVKRRFGSELDSHNDVMKTKELLYRVLAYNCHRMCIISCFVLVMISRKPMFYQSSSRTHFF